MWPFKTQYYREDWEKIDEAIIEHSSINFVGDRYIDGYTYHLTLRNKSNGKIKVLSIRKIQKTTTNIAVLLAKKYGITFLEQEAQLPYRTPTSDIN